MWATTTTTTTTTTAKTATTTATGEAGDAQERQRARSGDARGGLLRDQGSPSGIDRHDLLTRHRVPVVSVNQCGGNDDLVFDGHAVVYDAAGRLVSAADSDSALAFTYDALGRVTSTDNDGTPDAPHVVLAAAYDALGRRTALSAVVDDTADFTNEYLYDALGRATRITQHGQTGGNAVNSWVVQTV